MHPKHILGISALLLAILAAVIILAGCGPINDAAWRNEDGYGTGQRGIGVPNGGLGSVHQKDTPPSPRTPG